MSTTTESAPGGSPDTSALDTPNAAPPADPPAPPKPPASPPVSDADKVRMTPAQFKERQEEAATAAQRKLLKDLGFEKPEDAKSALARLKALEDKELSDTERAEKARKELEREVESAKPIKAVAADAMSELLATLPEAQRKAIEEEAGDSPQERMRLYRLTRKLMPSAPIGDTPSPAAPPAAPSTPAAPPPPAPPATTAPPPGAPRPGAVKSKWDQWQEMVSRSDRGADIFYNLNARAIEASRPH